MNRRHARAEARNLVRHFQKHLKARALVPQKKSLFERLKYMFTFFDWFKNDPL